MKRSYASPETSKLTRGAYPPLVTHSHGSSQTRAPAVDTLASGRRPGNLSRQARAAPTPAVHSAAVKVLDRRVGRPRARARLEARREPVARRAARRAREPRHRRPRAVPPGARGGRRGPALALPRARRSTSSSSAPRRRSWSGSPTRSAAAGVAVFGPTRAAARIEGSKSFAKDVLEAAGVPTAAATRGRATALRRQGRRARGRQGRLRLPHPGGARRRPARGRRARRRAR